MKPSTAPGEPCCRRCSRNFGRTTAWHWGGPPRNGWGSSMSSSCWGTSCWDGIMNEVVTKYILSLVNITHIISHIYSCGFLDIARVGVWLASVFTENRPTCKGETCFTLWGCLKLITSNKTDRNGSKWIYLIYLQAPKTGRFVRYPQMFAVELGMLNAGGCPWGFMKPMCWARMLELDWTLKTWNLPSSKNRFTEKSTLNPRSMLGKARSSKSGNAERTAVDYPFEVARWQRWPQSHRFASWKVGSKRCTLEGIIPPMGFRKLIPTAFNWCNG